MDRALNVEIGVEYRKIFIVVFFYAVVKCILCHFQDKEKVGRFQNIAEQLVGRSFEFSKKQKRK